ncbi:MAG: NUDIX domain-containing protein, partial [Anaerolineae bacterium]|nr:NUDIX domain-containing protein [Anaerolineae bacterium]
ASSSCLSKDFAPGVWECVTGRVEQQESFVQALEREIVEEVGFHAPPAWILGTSHFYRGEECDENELLGVIFGCEVEGVPEIVLSHEHDAYKWVTVGQTENLLDLSNPSSRWLKRVLKRADSLRQLSSQEVSTYLKTHPFEFD